MHLDLPLLLRVMLYSSAALLACLVLRRVLRAWLGATAAYAIWAAVPLAVLAAAIPGPPIAAALPKMPAMVAMPLNLQSSEHAWAGQLLAVWLTGGVAMAVALWWRQHRFMRRLGVLHALDGELWAATRDVGLPVSVGLWRPRIVLPMDSIRLQRRRTYLDPGPRASASAAWRSVCQSAGGTVAVHRLVQSVDASGMARVSAGSVTGLRRAGADALSRQAPQLRHRDAQDPLWCRLDADGLPLECAARAHPARGCIAEACGGDAPRATQPARRGGNGGDGQWRLLGVPACTIAGHARTRQCAGFPRHAAARVSA